MWGQKAHQIVRHMLPKGSSILDIGSGKGEQAEQFKTHGYRVVTVDLCGPADCVGDYLDLDLGYYPDCLWCCHVLEHQRNAGLFLGKMFRDLGEGGLLAITVPPRKDDIVGGHLTIWNPGLLVYNLILAGFDCSDAEVFNEGYDISCIVRKKSVELPDLTMDRGDIDRLSDFFPFPVKDGFNGWKTA